MRIASAQISAVVGDIEANLKKHYELIEVAAQNKVDLIIFPEMSITGYCREKGRALAFRKQDERLTRLRTLSDGNDITIIAGAPLVIGGNLFIGSFIIRPGQELQIYTKQYLHKGEEIFYACSFSYDPILEIKGERIFCAICADISNELHPEQAKDRNCTIYLASIFFSNNGITEGQQTLANYASEYSFAVVMSNYCGNHWELEAGGKSAFWNREGVKIVELDATTEGLLVAEKKDNNWEVKVFKRKDKKLQLV